MTFKEIDDFDSIEQGGADREQWELSNVYSVRLGGFGNTELLRTYLTSAKVKDLMTDLDFYETLTKDKTWPISQIIQREVDKIRVSNISKSYILVESRPIKYFPPIIIAILPKTPTGMISSEMVFVEPRNNPALHEKIYHNSKYHANVQIKPYVLNAKNLSEISGFFVLEVSKVFETYLLSWDKSQYFAVVIDGQHRLKALLRSAKDNPEVENYYQDLVFIDFSGIVKKKQELTPVDVVRRIFVDINTNAKRVGFVRQILMDDKDISALCVQSLVDSVSKDGSVKPEGLYLCSQVVDWHGEKLKHTLPHLTGILSLYQIIDDYLVQNSINSIDDLRSSVKVSRWVTRLNDVFFVDATINNQENDAFSTITPLHTSLLEYEERRNRNSTIDSGHEEDSKETELFHYDYSVLDVAQYNFERIYLESFVRLFNCLEPHRRAITLLEELGAFTENKVLAEALVSSPSKIDRKQSLKTEISKAAVAIKTALDKSYFLLFTVLGQKSIYSLFFKRVQMTLNPDFNGVLCMRVTTDYLTDINKLCAFCNAKQVSLFGNPEKLAIDTIDSSVEDFGAIAIQFWDGIIYDNNNIVYNTQGIRSLTFLIDEFICLLKARDSEISHAFSMLNVPYAKMRTKRILKKRFNLSDDSATDATEKVLDLKTKFILDYFNPQKI